MPSTARTDVVLPMTNDYMQQIVRGEKNYEFRKYRIAPTVKRVWFYLTAPFSCISYVCEIDTAVTRNHEGDDPKLPEDGLGNKEYNTFHIDWEGYDFAYRVRSVYEIIEPITLAKMKSRYGCKGAPRGLIYLPEGIANDVPWKSQKCIIPDDHRESGKPAPRKRVSPPSTRSLRATVYTFMNSEGKNLNVILPPASTAVVGMAEQPRAPGKPQQRRTNPYANQAGAKDSRKQVMAVPPMTTNDADPAVSRSMTVGRNFFHLEVTS